MKLGPFNAGAIIFGKNLITVFLICGTMKVVFKICAKINGLQQLNFTKYMQLSICQNHC